MSSNDMLPQSRRRLGPLIGSAFGPMFVFGLLTLAVGCAREPSGVRVHGVVKFKGEPTPVGRIYFDPDSSRKDNGRQGFADIRDGKFDTAQGGKAPSPGVVVARIEGFAAGATAKEGKLLFSNYEVKLELSEPTVEKNFDVPASAGNKTTPGSGP